MWGEDMLGNVNVACELGFLAAWLAYSQLDERTFMWCQHALTSQKIQGKQTGTHVPRSHQLEVTSLWKERLCWTTHRSAKNRNRDMKALLHKTHGIWKLLDKQSTFLDVIKAIFTPPCILTNNLSMWAWLTYSHLLFLNQLNIWHAALFIIIRWKKKKMLKQKTLD